MAHELIAVVVDDNSLTLDEVAASCMVSREWVVEHVHAGVLLADPDTQPKQWLFSGNDLLRARCMHDLERKFDANPELAGLVADLLEEIQRLRAQLRHTKG